MANAEVLTQLIEKIQATGDSASEECLNSLLVPIESVYILFEILNKNENETIRKLACICIKKRILHSGEEVPPEHLAQIEELLIESIKNEPSLSVCYQIVYLATSLFGSLQNNREEVVWGELIEFAFALLQDQDHLDLAFFMWKNLDVNIQLLPPESPYTHICNFAIENFSNPNQEVRIKASEFIQDALWKIEAPSNPQEVAEGEVDPNVLQQALLESIGRAYYELGDDAAAFNEAHTFSVTVYEGINCDFIGVRQPFIDFFISVIQDERLTNQFRYEAACALDTLCVPLFDQQDSTTMPELLNTIIEFTMYQANNELENKTYEIFYNVIWAISVSVDDDFPLRTVLQTLEALKEDMSDEARCVGLFLIGAVTEGSREYIVPVLPSLAETINAFGDSENEFIINNTCNLYSEMIDQIPEIIGIIGSEILSYATANFPHEGTVNTILNLLNTIKERPDGLSDLLGEFVQGLQDAEAVDGQEVFLYLIGSCLSHPTEPNEDIYTELAPGLVQMAQGSEELIAPVLHVFSKLVYTSPGSVTSDIESIVQFAIESISTENIEQSKNAINLLDNLVAFLPITLQPYLEVVVQAIWGLKEAIPIEPPKSAANSEMPEDTMIGLHTEMLHIIGRLVTNYPEEMTPHIEEIVEIFKKNIDTSLARPVAAAEGCLYACEGFAAIGMEAIEFFVDIACTITRLLMKEDSKQSINAYYNFFAFLFKVAPDIIETDKGQSLVNKLKVGFEGELTEFLAFETSNSLDPIILPSFFSLFFTLLRIPSSQIEDISEYFLTETTFNVEIHNLMIGAFTHYGMSIIVKMSEDKEELYQKTLTNAMFSFQKGHGPYATEASLLAITNAMITDSTLFCTTLSVEPAQLIETFVKFAMQYFAVGKGFPQTSNAVITFIGTIIVQFGVDGLQPEFLAQLAERMPPPIDTPHIALQAPFMLYALEHWPDIFEPRLDSFSVNVLASIKYYFDKIPEEFLQVFLEHAQALDSETQLAYLNGNQSLLLRLTRNIEMITADK